MSLPVARSYKRNGDCRRADIDCDPVARRNHGIKNHRAIRKITGAFDNPHRSAPHRVTANSSVTNDPATTRQPEVFTEMFFPQASAVKETPRRISTFRMHSRHLPCFTHECGHVDTYRFGAFKQRRVRWRRFLVIDEKFFHCPTHLDRAIIKPNRILGARELPEQSFADVCRPANFPCWTEGAAP